MIPGRAAVFALVLALLTPIAAVAELQTVNIKEFGLRFDLPERFVVDEDWPEGSGILRGFMSDQDEDGFFRQQVFIRPTQTVLPQSLWTQGMLSKLPGEPELMRWKWNGMVINGSRAVEEINGWPHLTYNALFPTLPHAVGVAVFGLEEDDDQLRALMHGILDSAKAPTNWTPGGHLAQDPPQTPDGRQLHVAFILSIPVVAPFLAGFLYSKGWKRAPRGIFLLLGLCGLVYMSSRAQGISELGGFHFYSVIAIGMMGLTWLIFGIGDLFRRRPRQQKQNRRRSRRAAPTQE